ncbi:MAG TPA: ATP-binding protein [Pyrinomonadaceae bacterium]|nr:ATP-binding protein [Pyrinomonadaceae bacterium]
MRTVQTIRIGDEGQVGAARRAVHRFSAPLGFSEEELAELDIVVQEIGTNAARYATGGGCLHWTLAPGDAPGVELFYWDKGPGIYDLDRAVSDGVSTSGSLGGGLGAIRRLMDEFDLYSTVRGTTRQLTRSRRTTHGTALLGRKWTDSANPRHVAQAVETARRTGLWSRPRPREEVNGDAYFMSTAGDQKMFAVIDGLGHGSGAHAAAQVALDSLAQWQGEPLDEVLLAVHHALRATRGAVMGACVVDSERGAFYYAGVGNVDVRVFNSVEPIRPIPNNGTLGVRLSAIRLWQYRWTEGATIVISSDGLSASWDINSYPGLLAKSPQLLAGVLLRDYGRDSDDATVLVVR